jgi:hypothetical protein
MAAWMGIKPTTLRPARPASRYRQAQPGSWVSAWPAGVAPGTASRAQIVKRALEAPLRQLVINAGLEPGV